MSDKPIARIVVPSLEEYPRAIISARLPDYGCEIVENDYLIRPALLSITQEDHLRKHQGMSVVAVLDLLYREHQATA